MTTIYELGRECGYFLADSVLTIENVEKLFVNRDEEIKELNLAFEQLPGGFLAIGGERGIGKTSIIRAISKQLTKDKKTVFIEISIPQLEKFQTSLLEILFKVTDFILENKFPKTLKEFAKKYDKKLDKTPTKIIEGITKEISAKIPLLSLGGRRESEEITESVIKKHYAKLYKELFTELKKHYSRVIIGLEDIDKLSDEEEATQVLSQLKSITLYPNVYWLCEISPRFSEMYQVSLRRGFDNSSGITHTISEGIVLNKFTKKELENIITKRIEYFGKKNEHNFKNFFKKNAFNSLAKASYGNPRRMLVLLRKLFNLLGNENSPISTNKIEKALVEIAKKEILEIDPYIRSQLKNSIDKELTKNELTEKLKIKGGYDEKILDEKVLSLISFYKEIEKNNDVFLILNYPYNVALKELVKEE